MQLDIDGWKAGLRFSACHIIPEHPRCSRLHGHTYTVHARVYGEPDEEHGFIIDSVLLQETLRRIISELDHKILLAKRTPGVSVREKQINNDEIEIIFPQKRYVFPRVDVAFLNLNVVSAENLAQWIMDRLLEEVQFPEKVTEVEIGLDEGWGQGAWVIRSVHKLSR